MPLGLRSSFEPAFWLLPAERRAALAHLHRFCRAVDHAVDEAASPERARAALEEWRGELAALYGAGAPRAKEARALTPVVSRYALKREDFDRFLAALEGDVRGARFEREGDLVRYCDGVAGAPGCLALSIFGCPEARRYAEELGRALQLTNVLRDLRADLAAGRLYLPLEDLARFGLTPQQMHEAARGGGTPLPGVSRLVRFERERARDWYAVAERAYHAQPRTSRRRLGAARAMQALYRALFDRLEHAPPLPADRLRPPARAVLLGVARAGVEAAIA